MFYGESRDRGQAMVDPGWHSMKAARFAASDSRELPDHLPLYLNTLRNCRKAKR